MNTSLGALVRHRRRTLCLTQAQLAQRMTSRGQSINVACIESGLAENPQPDTLNALAAALDWPLGILDQINGEGTARAVSPHLRLLESANSTHHPDLEQLDLARVELKALRELHTALQQWIDDLEARVQTVLVGVSSRGQPVRFDD